MANQDRPNGMWPVVGKGGSASPRITEYLMSLDASAVAMGMPVCWDLGLVKVFEYETSLIVGVSAQFKTSTASVGRKSIMVFDDPHQVFEIQADGSRAAAGSWIGLHSSFVNGSTYTAATGQSVCEFDESIGERTEIEAGQSHQLMVVGESQKIGSNEAALTNPRLHVKWTPNCHVFTKLATVGTDA